MRHNSTRERSSFAQLLPPSLLARLKYVVALVLAQSTVFVALKNIKMVTVASLARPIFGWSGATGGVEVVSCHMRQLSTYLYEL